MVQTVYVHFLACSTNHERVCTCTWIYWNVGTMYIHVHDFTCVYIHGTYTFMNIYICMYQDMTHLYSFKTTLHFPSGQISLATPASLSSLQALLLQSSLLPIISLLTCQTTQALLATSNLKCFGLYHVHSMYIHCLYIDIQCICMYMHSTLVMQYMLIPQLNTISYSSEQPLWYGCTMLSYRNMLFCTDSVQRSIYPLRIILPGMPQGEWSSSPGKCYFVYMHAQTMYTHFTYMACTILRFYEHVYRKINKRMAGFWVWTHDPMHTSQLPWPLCYQRDCAWYESCCYSRLIYLGGWWFHLAVPSGGWNWSK